MKAPEQWKKDFPFLNDEDYFRVITPAEFERRLDEYYDNKGSDFFYSILIAFFLVAGFVLVGGGA